MHMLPQWRQSDRRLGDGERRENQGVPVPEVDQSPHRHGGLTLGNLNPEASVAPALARPGPHGTDTLGVVDRRILIIAAAHGTGGGGGGICRTAKADLPRRKRTHPHLHQHGGEAEESGEPAHHGVFHE